jgi:Icc protein
MKLVWLSDLHLDHTASSSRQAFYQRLSGAAGDAFVITGDISISRLLAAHLGEIAQACAPRKVYFLLGNHDFYGSSFDEVDRIAAACCAKYSNLQHLGLGEVVRLGPVSALVGHRGWADGRAYGGRRTNIRFPDQDGIRDLRYRSTYPAFRKMERLGRASGDYFRRVLPYALTSFRHVLVATHVPPFARAVRFSGKPCDSTRLPHYVNASAGAVIQRVGEHFPRTKITVLCGHAHHGNAVRLTDNLEVRVGQACKGAPAIQGVIES